MFVQYMLVLRYFNFLKCFKILQYYSTLPTQKFLIANRKIFSNIKAKLLLYYYIIQNPLNTNFQFKWIQTVV